MNTKMSSTLIGLLEAEKAKEVVPRSLIKILIEVFTLLTVSVSNEMKLLDL